MEDWTNHGVRGAGIDGRVRCPVFLGHGEEVEPGLVAQAPCCSVSQDAGVFLCIAKAHVVHDVGVVDVLDELGADCEDDAGDIEGFAFVEQAAALVEDVRPEVGCEVCLVHDFQDGGHLGVVLEDVGDHLPLLARSVRGRDVGEDGGHHVG